MSSGTRMTPEVLLDACRENGGYELPALNTQLYLHFRGFRKIEGLDDFTNLKALWLESNGLQKLENLDQQRNLKCLYVQQNLIRRLENIESLVSLVILDVSQNQLTKLENISCLPCLESLNASKNSLADADALAELSGCQSLATLDLSSNMLEGDGVLDAIACAPKIVSFKLSGNPVMSTPHVRKKMIFRMPRLVSLDRPVFEAERRAAEAWGHGGQEAEVKARADYKEKQRLKAEEEQRHFREWKAAKISERLQNSGMSSARESSTAPESCGDVIEGAVDTEPNVPELIHNFWASNENSEDPSPVPNPDGSFDAASFRAPPIVPDPYAQTPTKSMPIPPPPPSSPSPSQTPLSAEPCEEARESVKEANEEPAAMVTDFNELD